MKHWVWPIVFVMVAVMGMDLASDIFLKPHDPGSARGWDWTATGTIAIAVFLLQLIFERDRKNDR